MPNRLYKILIILAILAIIAAIPIFWLTYNSQHFLEVDYLDVGQGDAILIKTPAGQNILIDGGPDNKVMKQLAENLPWWDRKIDMIVLTHPHDDHVSGLIPVIKNYQIGKVLFTGALHTGPNYLAWLNLLKSNHISPVVIDHRETIAMGSGLSADILYPTGSLMGKEYDNLNNTSIVIKLKYGRTSFLFMGDAEKETEEDLLKSNETLAASVIKVGHHGSDTSSTQGFVDAVKPQMALIEVGADNKFGHPSHRVLKRWQRAGSRVYRTDLDRTIRLKSDGTSVAKEN